MFPDDTIDVEATAVSEAAAEEPTAEQIEALQQQQMAQINELLGRLYHTATGELPADFPATFGTELINLNEDGSRQEGVGFLFAVNYGRLVEGDRDIKLIIEAFKTLSVLQAEKAVSAQQAKLAAEYEAQQATEEAAAAEPETVPEVIKFELAA